MFHSSHIHMPNRHRQRTALRTFFPSSSFSPPDSKEPLRRGILFSSVASVLLLVGCILTWLEFNDMFGGKISMTGPLLIAVALLMMLLSLRQFRLARKRNRTNSGPMQLTKVEEIGRIDSQITNRKCYEGNKLEAVSAGGVTALVIDQEEGMGQTTVVVDAWEEERPENAGIRINEDLAPPSYTDVAQLSCSSNCPSFVSHDDRNEAPPTYEETCGMFSYESESSLAQSSRRCSSQTEASPSPAGVSHGFFQHDPHFINRNSHVHTPVASTSNNQTSVNPHTLSPGSALLISAWQRNMQKGVKSDAAPCDITETSSNASISSEETVATVDPCLASKPENVESQTIKRAEWGQRSFSSIPSYTCLLSESGEVSAQVYNTSTIISQMLPNESNAGTSFDSFLGTSTTGPTRSHSTSSINSLRQGVPYNMAGSSTHLSATVQASKTDSGSVRRSSEGSGPSDEMIEGRRNGSRQRSDSNIASESNVALLPSAIQASGSKGTNSVNCPNQENFMLDKASSSNTCGSSGPHVSAVRRRSSGGHEVLLLNTQDVQETI